MPSLEREPVDITRQSVTKHSEAADEFEKVLRSLLPKVPMTMKGALFLPFNGGFHYQISDPRHYRYEVPHTYPGTV
jgi:hypothetical protein